MRAAAAATAASAVTSSCRDTTRQAGKRSLTPLEVKLLASKTKHLKPKFAQTMHARFKKGLLRLIA